MPVPFSFLLPITRSQGTSWPESVPMFTHITVGQRPGEHVVVIKDVNLHVTSDGRWDAYVTREGERVESYFAADDLVLMTERVRAVVEDMHALGENARQITDDSAAAYGLGLATHPTPTGPHGVLRVPNMPDIDDVPNWPGALPHPDRLRWDERQNAVVIDASYRTFVVHGEVVTEKGQQLVLDEAARASIAAWASTFLLARERVQLFLHHHTFQLVDGWVDRWQKEQELAAI